MENKRVYTHYYRDGNIEYRWRTIIQIGNSWEKCGTIFMKNPGSSTHCEKTPSPIVKKEILDNLRKFDYEEIVNHCEWYEFSVDNTMNYVIKLFETYYRKPLNGVIQIFNLFNIRGANLGEAIGKSNGSILEQLAYTVEYDVKHIVSPVYLGWGDLWKNQKFSEKAEKIFNEVRQKTSYLSDGIQNNKYYHPQYLMNYGKNKLDCIITLTRFVKNEINPKGLDCIIPVPCKSPINIVHVIELVTTNQKFQLTKIEKDDYSLSDNLMIRITKSNKGYLAIRHKTFNGKIQYSNLKYDFTERYRNILKEKGWNCDTPVWLGTKLIKDYGCKDDEIVTKIVSEVNDIVELVNKDN